MSDGQMTYEDWLRGCVHHDGRHGYVTLPCDEVLKIADFIEKLRADRKTENSSENPNNCDDCIWSVCNYNKVPWDTDCNGCKFVGSYDTEFPCVNCSRKTKDYYTKDEQLDKDTNVRSKEPQTGKCPHDSICAKPCKECGACDKECGLWEILKTEPQTERSSE